MKKAVKNAALVLLFLALCAAVAYLAYLQLIRRGEKDLSGQWTMELDLTEHASVTALSWLQEIEAVSVSLEEIEAGMDNLKVQVDLTFEQTDRSGGTFLCSVSSTSYDACRQKAYEAFAAAFRELLAQRLRMAGYEGGTDQETIEALVAETFGMSTVSYLMSCVPKLLPSLEELQAEYEGSGAYEAEEGILTRQYGEGRDAVARTERYIRQGCDLVFLEEVDSARSPVFFHSYPVIYTLEITQE